MSAKEFNFKHLDKVFKYTTPPYPTDTWKMATSELESVGFYPPLNEGLLRVLSDFMPLIQSGGQILIDNLEPGAHPEPARYYGFDRPANIGVETGFQTPGIRFCATAGFLGDDFAVNLNEVKSKVMRYAGCHADYRVALPDNGSEKIKAAVNEIERFIGKQLKFASYSFRSTRPVGGGAYNALILSVPCKWNEAYYLVILRWLFEPELLPLVSDTPNNVVPFKERK